MFLSQKKSTSSSSTKGLNSLKIDSLTAPSHISPKEVLPASLQYRPASKMPTRGETELTREDRHRNHLRKKRLQKIEKKRKDASRRELAATTGNKKIKAKIEKEDALKKLGKNRSVQIIGGNKRSKK